MTLPKLTKPVSNQRPKSIKKLVSIKYPQLENIIVPLFTSLDNYLKKFQNKYENLVLENPKDLLEKLTKLQSQIYSLLFIVLKIHNKSVSSSYPLVISQQTPQSLNPKIKQLSRMLTSLDRTKNKEFFEIVRLKSEEIKLKIYALDNKIIHKIIEITRKQQQQKKQQQQQQKKQQQIQRIQHIPLTQLLSNTDLPPPPPLARTSATFF